VSQRLHTGLAIHDDEWTGIGAGATEDIFVQGADVYGDNQTTHNVEQAQADPDGSHSFGNRATGIFSLGCDEAGILATRHGEDTCRHDAEEAFEAVDERRLVPVTEADGFGGCSAGGDDLLRTRVVSVEW
jgi:hypothetical protein